MRLRPLEEAFEDVLVRRTDLPIPGTVGQFNLGRGRATATRCRDLIEKVSRTPTAAMRFADQLDLVGGLVLDGVLEATLDSNSYVSGVGAVNALTESTMVVSESRLHELSCSAVRLAAAVRGAGVLEATKLLYRYNTVPSTSSMHQPGPASTHHFLGLDDADLGDLLAEVWSWNKVDPTEQPWFSWSDPSSPRAQFKLYVSPRLEAVPEAFRAVVRESTHHHAPFMKIGSTFFNLRRPDKFVLYFPSIADLSDAATHLRTVLAGVPGHGVPFTGQLCESGILSWGVDPEGHGPEPVSWRVLVARTLAESLVRCDEGVSGDDAAGFALARLALEGVDIQRWTLREYQTMVT